MKLNQLGFFLFLAVGLQLVSCEWFHINQYQPGFACVATSDGYRCPSLQAAFQYPASTYYINMESNITYFMTPVSVNVPVYVYGNNYYAAYSNTNVGSIISVSAPIVYVTGMKFVNLTSLSPGVAISASASTQVTINNCIFMNLVSGNIGSTYSAGAVMVTLSANAYFDGSSLVFNNCYNTNYLNANQMGPSTVAGALHVNDLGTGYISLFNISFTDNGVVSSMQTQAADILIHTVNPVPITTHSLLLSHSMSPNYLSSALYTFIIIGPSQFLTLSNTTFTLIDTTVANPIALGSIMINGNSPKITFLDVRVMQLLLSNKISQNAIVSFVNLGRSYFYYQNFNITLRSSVSTCTGANFGFVELINSQVIFAALSSSNFIFSSNLPNQIYFYIDSTSSIIFNSAPSNNPPYVIQNTVPYFYVFYSSGLVFLDPNNVFSIVSTTAPTNTDPIVISLGNINVLSNNNVNISSLISFISGNQIYNIINSNGLLSIIPILGGNGNLPGGNGNLPGGNGNLPGGNGNLPGGGTLPGGGSLPGGGTLPGDGNLPGGGILPGGDGGILPNGTLPGLPGGDGGLLPNGTLPGLPGGDGGLLPNGTLPGGDGGLLPGLPGNGGTTNPGDGSNSGGNTGDNNVCDPTGLLGIGVCPGVNISVMA